MSQLLNLFVNIIVYSDGAESNNPQLRDVDYSRKFYNVPTGNPFTRCFTVPPQATLSVVQLARTLLQDLTTQYLVTLQGNTTYRFQFVGGTNPVLRTARVRAYNALTEFDVTKVGDVVRYTWNGTGADPNFATNGVIVGDAFHVEAGGNFNPLNEGTFTVVTVTDDYVEVLNSSGVAELSVAVGPSIGGAIPLDYYSAAGVQVDDQVRITDAAFNIENRGVFTVTAVTSTYFEISNGNPGIPEGPVTLTAVDGVVFYPDVYKLCYIESDRKAIVRINGSTTNYIELEPIISGDPKQVAVFLVRGPVYKLELVNSDLQTANIKVVLTE